MLTGEATGELSTSGLPPGEISEKVRMMTDKYKENLRLLIL